MNETDKKAFEEAMSCLGEGIAAFPMNKVCEYFFEEGVEYARQPAEPRYWVHNFGAEDGGEEFYDHPTGSDCPDCIPLYTIPQPAPLVRLTDNEIRAAFEEGNKRYLKNEVPGTLRLQCAYALMDAMGAQPAPDVRELCLILKEADRELQACQAVLWNLERDGIDPAYGKGAREAQAKIKATLAKHAKPTHSGDIQQLGGDQ